MSAQQRLDAIDARAMKATSGPWVLHSFGKHSLRVGIDYSSSPTSLTGSLAPENAEFIAAARQDVPVMATALRAILKLHDPFIQHNKVADLCLFNGGYSRSGETCPPCDALRNGEPVPQKCTHCRDPFPCSTVRIIETELAR